MTSEEGAQTFQTDDVHYPDLGRAPDLSCRVGNLLQPITRNERKNSILMTLHYRDLGSTSEKYYPDLGSEASSVWNYCARFSVRHFTEKTVVTSQNVDSFLRLAL